MKWYAMNLSTGLKYEASNAQVAGEIAAALKISTGYHWCVVQTKES